MSERNQLKLALVMSGGVSLAIWIGGVSREIYALWLASQNAGNRGKGSSPYRDLLDMAKVEVTIDVLAGASAGGVNGVLLGAAMSRRCSTAGFDEVRNIWLDAAAPDVMLRSLREKNPPSLLRGEDEYRPRLERALKSLLTGEYQHGAVKDLRLVVTATDIKGRAEDDFDNFGEAFHQRKHAATFTFTQSDFGGDPGRLAARLAVAGRSSSSFPLAFEPSFVAVGTGSDDPPDMAGVADFDTSRFIVDGGVLNNKPVDLALDELKSIPSRASDQRLVLFVEPDPAGPESKVEAKPDEPPSLASVLLESAVNIPRKLYLGEALEQLDADNERLRNLRSARNWLAVNVITPAAPTAGSPPAGAQKSSEKGLDEAYERFREIREQSTIKSISRRLAAGLPTDMTQRQKVVACAVKKLIADEDFLPEEFGEFVKSSNPDLDEWKLGLTPIEYMLGLVKDYLRVALRDGAVPKGLEPMLIEHRKLTTIVADIDVLSEIFWEITASTDLPVGLFVPRRDWIETSWRRWPVLKNRQNMNHAKLARFNRTLEQLKASVDDAGFDGKTALDQIDDTWVRKQLSEVAVRGAGLLLALRKDQSSLKTKEVSLALKALVPVDSNGQLVDETTIIKRVLWLYVVESSLAGESAPRSLGVPVEWMLITSETTSPLSDGRQSNEKVAGIQLAHFGAFLKRSWRANDWMWGRLDGTAKLSQALFSPSRLLSILGKTTDQQFEENAKDFHRKLKAFVGELPENQSSLDRARPLVDEPEDAFVKRAKTAIDDASGDDRRPSDALQMLAGNIATLVTWRQQVRIAAEELPVVARAVEHDNANGAGMSADARAFCKETQTHIDGLGDPAVAAHVLRSCKVGAETVEDFSGSDAFAETAANAAGLIVSAGAGSNSGFGPAKRVMQLATVPTTVLAYMAGMLRRRSTVTLSIVVALLVSAVLTLVAGAMGADVPVVFETLAVSALLAFGVLAWLSHGKISIAVALGLALLAIGSVAIVGGIKALLTPEASFAFVATGGTPMMVTPTDAHDEIGATVRCVSGSSACSQEADEMVVVLADQAVFAIDTRNTDWPGGDEPSCDGLIKPTPVAGETQSTGCELLESGSTWLRTGIGSPLGAGAITVAAGLSAFFLVWVGLRSRREQPSQNRPARSGIEFIVQVAIALENAITQAKRDFWDGVRATAAAVVGGLIGWFTASQLVGPGLSSSSRSTAISTAIRFEPYLQVLSIAAAVLIVGWIVLGGTRKPRRS